jgi:hypothetical protein
MCYSMRLLKLVWLRWRLFKKLIRAKAVVVHKNNSRFTVINRSWRAWRIAYERGLRRGAYNMLKAAPHGNRAVYRYIWDRWREFMVEVRFEREVALRSAKTWSKVQSWMNEGREHKWMRGEGKFIKLGPYHTSKMSIFSFSSIAPHISYVMPLDDDDKRKEA